MGTPDFAIPALKALIGSYHEVIAVYSQPPKPAGRGQKETKSPIHMLAEENSIPVYCPTTLKNQEEQDKFKELKADIAVVAAYGLILPKPILEETNYGCVNIHPSALPRWRGAAPIQRTILAGDKETAICIMQMDEGLDTGDIIEREDFQLPLNITSGELHDITANKGALLLLKALDKIEQKSVSFTKQDSNGITYATKINKSEAQINWNEDVNIIDNKIRGYNPFPYAYFVYKNENIKVIEAEIVDSEKEGVPGEIISSDLQIQVGKGVVRLKKLQRPGKNIVSAKDFLNGFNLQIGTIL